jgi:hypothetical protein
VGNWNPYDVRRFSCPACVDGSDDGKSTEVRRDFLAFSAWPRVAVHHVVWHLEVTRTIAMKTCHQNEIYTVLAGTTVPGVPAHTV